MQVCLIAERAEEAGPGPVEVRQTVKKYEDNTHAALCGAHLDTGYYYVLSGYGCFGLQAKLVYKPCYVVDVNTGTADV